MPLTDIPAIRLPEGTRFFIAAFLAVFFFFFTRARPETTTETTTGQPSQRT